MSTIPSLKTVLRSRDGGEFEGLSEIEDLIRTAILDPNDETKKRLAEILNEILNHRLEGGFCGDNQLFIKIRTPTPTGYDVVPIYVCDLPKEHIGHKQSRLYRK